MITAQTATDIAVAHKEIEVAEKLLADVREAMVRSVQTDIRDVFGRRQRLLELGIPSGDNSTRMLRVPYELAVPVIEANIAHQRSCIKALNQKARYELDADEVAA